MDDDAIDNVICSRCKKVVLECVCYCGLDDDGCDDDSDLDEFITQ